MSFQTNPPSSEDQTKTGESEEVVTDQPTTDNSGQQKPDEGASNPDSAFLIVGERAFRSRDDVIKNIEHSQNHISTLESERAEERKIIDQLRQENENLRKAAEAVGSKGNEGETANLSNDELVKRAAEMAAQSMRDQESAAQQKKNLDGCVAIAKETYGDNYTKTVTDKANELGMTIAEVDALASRAPQAWEKLFIGETQSDSSFQPSQGNVQSSVAQQKPNQQQPQNIMKIRTEKGRMDYVRERMAAASNQQ